jgi:hypothetical protein
VISTHNLQGRNLQLLHSENVFYATLTEQSDANSNQQPEGFKVRHATHRATRLGNNGNNTGYNAGVPQGTVTSPILFNILINSLPDIILSIKGIRMKLFADNVIIWVNGKSPTELEKTMRRALTRLKKWTEDNGLTINASKTTYDFYTTAHQVPEIQLYLGNDKIEYCENPTYLKISRQKTKREITYLPNC